MNATHPALARQEAQRLLRYFRRAAGQDFEMLRAVLRLKRQRRARRSIHGGAGCGPDRHLDPWPWRDGFPAPRRALKPEPLYVDSD